MDTNFFAGSAMPPVVVVAAVPAAKVISRRRHACLYSSNYGRGRGVGRALGVGVTLGAGVALGVGVAVAVGVTWRSRCCAVVGVYGRSCCYCCSDSRSGRSRSAIHAPWRSRYGLALEAGSARGGSYY